jgi:predicted kinase
VTATSTSRGSLIVVSGLPGVGKTAVAAEVALRTGGVHLSIDPVEDAMLACGLPPDWNLGVAAYEAVRAMAASNLALGRTVVVDAVNDSQDARQTWQRAADQYGAPVAWASLTCSNVDEHRRRVEERSRGFSRLPDPSWTQVLDRARAYAPWTFEHLEVDTFGMAVRQVGDRVCVYAEDRRINT